IIRMGISRVYLQCTFCKFNGFFKIVLLRFLFFKTIANTRIKETTPPKGLVIIGFLVQYLLIEIQCTFLLEILIERISPGFKRINILCNSIIRPKNKAQNQ